MPLLCAFSVSSKTHDTWISLDQAILEENYDLAAPPERKLITIQRNRSDAHLPRPFEGGPLVLDYTDILEHCRFDQAHPKPKTAIHEIFLWRSVGVALFRHHNLIILVAWGEDIVPWCSVQLFREVRQHSRFLAIFAERLSVFTTKELIDCLEWDQTQLQERDLTAIFKVTPSVTLQPFITNTPVASVMFGSAAKHLKLSITGSWESTKFIGREIRRLKLRATLVSIKPQADTGSRSKSWFSQK